MELVMAFSTAFLSVRLLAVFHIPAQEITASHSGTVRDPTGAFISNSTLTVTNECRRARFEDIEQ